MTKLDQIWVTRKEWIEGLQSGLTSLDERLDELETRVREAEPVKERYQRVVDRARATRGALEQAVDDVRNAAEDAWTVFARESDRVLERLRTDLGVTEAEVAAEFAEARASLAAVAAGLAKTWQRQIDALRVQFELGKADAGDAFDEAWTRLEHRYADLRRRVESMTDDTAHTVDELRESLRGASQELRAAYDEAAERIERGEGKSEMK